MKSFKDWREEGLASSLRKSQEEGETELLSAADRGALKDTRTSLGRCK